MQALMSTHSGGPRSPPSSPVVGVNPATQTPSVSQSLLCMQPVVLDAPASPEVVASVPAPSVRAGSAGGRHATSSRGRTARRRTGGP